MPRTSNPDRLVTLDGSRGEGGGQILRTALTLSLVTGRPFRIVKVRQNRDKPGLRPQHLAAVEAAATLGAAEVAGAAIGSRDVTFRPGPYEARDLSIDIGTAGSTAMVLQTLHLPLALRAQGPVRLTLTGGTFNTKAPSFPFLDETWRRLLAAIGMPVTLAMPSAGYYPRGGGRLEAWIEPAKPRPWTYLERGALTRIVGVAGITNLHDVRPRMRNQALERLEARGLTADIGLVEWPGVGQGAAIALTAEHDGLPATFVGLGARGKPAEAVADEAVDELLDYLDSEGAIDPHSADQILLPLALAEGRSEYTVAAVTEHLRTNVETIRAFLDRPITIDGPGHSPSRVIVGP
ncbi:MAG TPA: RNA 3'-terminal phosphate cyclase [Isosphaeraceae bacterium]|nr:RNA 3'-terminal phosphate cyclase [Isosphaeraceae bacterium]